MSFSDISLQKCPFSNVNFLFQNSTPEIKELWFKWFFANNSRNDVRKSPWSKSFMEGENLLSELFCTLLATIYVFRIKQSLSANKKVLTTFIKGSGAKKHSKTSNSWNINQEHSNLLKWATPFWKVPFSPKYCEFECPISIVAKV